MGSKGPLPLGGSRAEPWPCLLLATLTLATSIAAAETLPQAEARLHAAKAEELRVAAERAAAAARLRGLEAATAATASRVAELARRQRAAEAQLAYRTGEIEPMLPVMQRLALYPAETLLAVPLPPEDAVRGLLVLGAISRQLEAEAASVRAGQAEAARLREATEAQLPQLAAAQTEQAREAASLDARFGQTRARRRVAEDEASEAARQAAAEAAHAETLRAALARLEAERQAAEERARAEATAAARQRHDNEATAARRRQQALARPAGPGLGEAHGQLTAPVAGSIIRGWGEAAESGLSNGVTYGAAPAARVVAPCAGRVVFASPFRSYGLLLIVDCGAGWHAVLAGLDHFDAQVGETLREGEPVGAMPAWDPRAGGTRPGLYLELRKGGQPVNPGPYLRARG
jgi:septal ring factor EnvC (AmiA/AmiB activator)